MAVLLKDRINFKHGGFEFDIKLREGITIILGDSATGKSLFYKNLETIVIAEDLKGFRLLNYKSKILVDVVSVLSESNKIIVVDNADILLKGIPYLNRIFKQSKSQFIIFGRQGGWYNINKYNCAHMYESNRKFQLQYLFEKEM